MDLNKVMNHVENYRKANGNKRLFTAISYTIDESKKLSSASRKAGITVSKTSQKAVLLGADYGETKQDVEYINNSNRSNRHDNEMIVHGFIKHNIVKDHYYLVYHDINNPSVHPTSEWTITYGDGKVETTSTLSDEQKALFQPSAFKAREMPTSMYRTVLVENINYLIDKE